MKEVREEEKDYSLGNGYMSIHEILASNGINQRNLINSVEREEKVEGRESYDMIEADITSNKSKTNLAKDRFISEIKQGLGDAIKKNPNTIIKPNITLLSRLGDIITKLFTKF